MALDKLVDSTQLDTDLTSVANAIRTKGGTSASLAFPSGFVSAIQAIPTGGGGSGYTADQIAVTNGISGDVVMSAALTANQRANAFRAITTITSFSSKYDFRFGGSMFYGCTGLTELRLSGMTNTGTASDVCRGCSSLRLVDFGTSSLNIGADSLRDCNSLATLILRGTSIAFMTTVNIFRNCNPVASGGSGITIYIPKALFDHLGDGTSSDYKAATNWSTLDGRGVITWAKLEGSAYESTTWWES